MKATDFQYHHPTLVHQLIVGAAFLTYLFEADDIVWWFVKNRPSPHTLERALFIVAALLIGLGAAICTRSHMFEGQRSRSYHVGEFLTPLGWARWRRYRDLSSWSSAKECESYVVKASGRESEIIVGYGISAGRRFFWWRVLSWEFQRRKYQARSAA